MFRKIEGMTWPAPSDALDDVQWRLRFSSPTKSDLLVAAGVMAAYNQMVADPKSKRDMIVRELRKGPNLTPTHQLRDRAAVCPVPLETLVGRKGSK